MNNKMLLVCALGFSSLIVGCGSDSSSESASDESNAVKKQFSSEVVGTWEKSCFPIYDPQDVNKILAYNSMLMTVKSDLSSTSKVEVYATSDSQCLSSTKTITMDSKFDVDGKISTDESYEAYAVNIIPKSIDGGSWESESTVYSLLYIDSEKMYFGQPSTNNTGSSKDKRHSGLNLKSYYTKVIY
ncbi:hypothetical protein [Photobacterium sanguinicancri]|uniref:hypothetical protein n=1 Tax=Photobacterium sanguinicancri TaxID=875932 RepID=UPI000788E961|nr:hypothetical protein [Photobacterium sanguinicancri]KXI23581.1 hypothetical protein AS132_07120 [Photobacterium sanguinicancri]